MGKGGKRPGAGRKKGSKDDKPRSTKKHAKSDQTKEELNEIISNYEDVTKPLYLNIGKYLNAKNKKLYKELQTENGTVLDSLKALRQDLMVRYNYGRIAEMEGVEAAKDLARLKLKELEEKGSIDGKKIKTEKLETMKTELNGAIGGSFPRLSTALTTLAGEIRQMNELIDRIESNREDLTLNIFNILQGGTNKKQAKDLTKRIFSMPDEGVAEADYEED